MKYFRIFETELNYDKYVQDGITMPSVNFIVESNRVTYFQNPPFYIDAIENLTVSFTLNQIQYSLDCQTWSNLSVGATTPIVPSGSRIYFKASDLIPTSDNGIGTFNISGKCNIGGSIMSMLYGDVYGNRNNMIKYAFRSLFYKQSNIIDASNLELSETVAEDCYRTMFAHCTSLVAPPNKFPATRLAIGCYEGMFYECTSLMKTPDLPSTELADRCYSSMFNGCTNLVECMSILPSTELKYECYASMFQNCPNLSMTPELPALELKERCYESMFKYGSKISYIKAMFLTPPEISTTGYWLRGVPSTGTFVKNPNAIWEMRSEHGIPIGWTIEKEITDGLFFNGKQYVLTDINLSEIQNLTVSFRDDSNDGETFRSVFGVYGFDGVNLVCKYSGRRNNSIKAYASPWIKETNASYSNIGSNIIENIVTMSDSKVVFQYGSVIMYNQSYNSSYPMHLMIGDAYHASENGTISYFNESPSWIGKIYYVHIHDLNGELLHNLVPYKVNDVLGLKDNITNQFYPQLNK